MTGPGPPAFAGIALSGEQDRGSDCLIGEACRQARTFRGADIRPRRRGVSVYFLVSLIAHMFVVALFAISGLRFHKPGETGPQAGFEDRHAFLVIEVPENVPEERPAEPTYLVSDRVARAADVSPEDLERTADPYADGETEIREFEAAGAAADQAGRQTEEAGGPEVRDPADTGDLAAAASPDEIAEYVVDDARGDRGGSPGRTPTFRNLLSDAGRRGGLSFNTYDWDFAPYMLAMKRAIESHLFPPYAFTHMGLVSGTNIVHFTVMPDGRIRSLEILGSDAHFSLDRTSVRAIESSVPFLPLPRDFPEEVLEVTAHFSYVIHGRD